VHGTNVQFRGIALHHLDFRSRPADVAQRDGRILRQGNHNGEVRILRYVTEKSFNGYMWQTGDLPPMFALIASGGTSLPCWSRCSFSRRRLAGSTCTCTAVRREGSR
jgi:hypothetical protein